MSKQQGDAQELKDELGRTRSLGFGSRNLESDFAFGSAPKPREWGVAECLTSSPAAFSFLFFFFSPR